jgi:sensor histidine kinase regulating citrate/malate metabolism
LALILEEGGIENIMWIAAAILTPTLLYLFYRFIIIKTVDNRIANYQKNLVQQHFYEIDNMYKKMRGWRHDYHNHIQVMKAYLELGKTEEMKRYLDDLSCDLEKIDTVIKTGNLMIDAILNSKIAIASTKGINVNVKATVPQAMKIPDLDLCVILGNLLDNAIEGCESLENTDERFVRIYIREIKGQLYIYVSNSFGRKVKRIDKRYLPLKRVRITGLA